MTYVLLHMFAGSARSWDAVVPLLDGPCVVPDLPGFGGVPDAAAGLVDWVSALIQPHPAVVLVGHSMGGKLAMAVAARRPANLVRLMLLLFLGAPKS